MITALFNIFIPIFYVLQHLYLHQDFIEFRRFYTFQVIREDALEK